MLLELSVPRNGVHNLFQPGKNQQICQRITWAVLRSHDVMGQYRRLHYKDDPTVSSELVKFLAVNTGYETLDVLTVKMKVVETELAAVKKEAAAATKTAHSASNKADEMKKFYDLLLKRVVKLESK